MSAVHYRPDSFPPDERLDWRELVPLIGPATAAVARYDAMLASVPSPDVLLASLATEEAVRSSRIEGTEATIGDVLRLEAGGEPESAARLEEIGEVVNCRMALRLAVERLAELPLSLRVVREAHAVLMTGVRGHGKAPGEFRRTPNWIGPPGCTIDQATFVPIGADRLDGAMAAWERYIHADAPDRLVQLAIVHAEFEALHPFLDGNGRLGRMLVPLFLWQVGLVRVPAFYISAYMEAHRDAYYAGLLSVSRNDDWTGWCRFFLRAVKAQAEDNLARTQGILQLYEDMKRRIAELTRSRYAIQALGGLFKDPIFRGPAFGRRTGIPPRTARRILDRLVDGGVLRVVVPGRGRRGPILAYPDVLRVAEGRERGG